MIPSICICGAVCIAMVLSILFKPQITVRRLTLDTYCLVAVVGAIIVLLSGLVRGKSAFDAMTGDTAVNPIKILVLFISMTMLSLFLEEEGFFGFLADKALSRSGKSQKKMFFVLYITVSVLTVFTSNDIIILTFTPFICYFSKKAEIDPIPYLVSEFIAANTWSMALIIGNPTNIYLATSNEINFAEYVKVMILPTIAAGSTALLILWMIFRKSLRKPIKPVQSGAKINDKVSLTVGIVLLGFCTVMMAIGSYIGVEMWKISLGCAILLYVVIGVISLVRHRKPRELIGCTKRAPWTLVPFVLSMFVVVLALSENGVTKEISSLLGESGVVYKYGITSYLAANVFNNIPMSVFYCPVISSAQVALRQEATFGAIIGSNIGAFLTPVGALAGIMWMTVLKGQDIQLGFVKFIKYGAAISVPTILAALAVTSVMV